MQRHRTGARGNATTFLLPWESVLLELERLEGEAAARKTMALPRTGTELKYVVQVLLKTHDDEDKDHLQKFTHQAQVNRKKAARCILAMKNRGHRAFRNVGTHTHCREKGHVAPGARHSCRAHPSLLHAFLLSMLQRSHRLC